MSTEPSRHRKPRRAGPAFWPGPRSTAHESRKEQKWSIAMTRRASRPGRLQESAARTPVPQGRVRQPARPAQGLGQPGGRLRRGRRREGAVARRRQGPNGDSRRGARQADLCAGGQGCRQRQARADEDVPRYRCIHGVAGEAADRRRRQGCLLGAVQPRGDCRIQAARSGTACPR